MCRGRHRTGKNWRCAPWNLRQPALAMVAVLLAASSGCHSGDAYTEAANSNLATLALFYSQFQAAHRGQLPQTKEELQGYIDSEGAGLLQEAGFKSSEELFISPRDNQPYVLRFGRDVIEASDGGGVIAYEKEGAHGVRYVGFRAGDVQPVAEAEFLQLVPKP